MSARAVARVPCGALLRGAAALALCLGIPLPAQAGGPLELVNQQPLVYPNGGASLTLNLDQGPFGPRTNAQADGDRPGRDRDVERRGTSTMRLAIGPQLSTDYTGANWT